MVNIRSNLHAGQYAGAGSVPSHHRQGQALVEPLSLPGVTWHINKFLCKSSSEKGQWTCHAHQWFSNDILGHFFANPTLFRAWENITNNDVPKTCSLKWEELHGKSWTFWKGWSWKIRKLGVRHFIVDSTTLVFTLQHETLNGKMKLVHLICGQEHTRQNSLGKK